MGLSKVTKGLKSYRTQEIPVQTDDTLIDPTEEVVVDYDKYKEYIERIVNRFWKKLPPNPRWDKDELRGEAWLALCECAEHYFNPEYNDSLKAFAYPYIIKRLSEFMAVNMYTLKARYYNVKKNADAFERINWLERTIWSESKGGSSSNAKSSEAAADDTNPLLSHPSGTPPTADIVADKEEQDIIKSIVNEDLPKRERRAIVRRFRDGESYREIGERLNVSPETARKLVLRGLKTIEKRAKDAGIASSEIV